MHDLDLLDELLDLWRCIFDGGVEAFDLLKGLSELDAQGDNTDGACCDANTSAILFEFGQMFSEYVASEASSPMEHKV